MYSGSNIEAALLVSDAIHIHSSITRVRRTTLSLLDVALRLGLVCGQYCARLPQPRSVRCVSVGF